MRLLLLSVAAALASPTGHDAARADPPCKVVGRPTAVASAMRQKPAPGLDHGEVAVECPDDVCGPRTATTIHVVTTDLNTPGLAVFDVVNSGVGGVALDRAGGVLRQLGAVDAIAVYGSGSWVMARRECPSSLTMLSDLAHAQKADEVCSEPKGATVGCQRSVGHAPIAAAPLAR